MTDESQPDPPASSVALRDDRGLTPKQEQAILALLREPTLTHVAKAVDVSERTVYRWLSEPGFKEAYRQARREVYNQALALVHKYAPIAVNTLARTLSDPMSAPHTKVAAAVAILKFGRDAIEVDDLQERVAALEKAMADGGTPTKTVYALEFDEGNILPPGQPRKETPS